MKISRNIVKWLLVLIFAIFVGITQWSILALIVMRYGAMLLVFLGISLVIYYFFYDAILQKCKSCRRLKSLVGAIIISAIIIILYNLINNPSGIIRMKEDIIYVLPKSKTQFNTDSIYDGTKNDPNLNREDEGTIRMEEDMLYIKPKKDTTIKK